jgi:uncharacterized protein YutE (UPF0331/DUF86 family)
MMPAPTAPLEGSDPERARVLKRKVADRIRDVRRHLDALVAAMAQFGEDFDRARFEASFESTDPDQLNRVKAVERGIDQLYNYMAELAAFGLELAAVRARHDETNARRDLDDLARQGVIQRERAGRLQRLRELRRLVVHEYASAAAAQVHEAALILAAELPPFYRAYAEWLMQGFPAREASA